MAKTGETGVRETVAKMSGTRCGKNGFISSWQKWVELTVAKMDGNHCGKMGVGHHGKNG